MKLNKYLSLGLVGLSMAFASCADDFLTAEDKQYVDKEVITELLENDPAFIDSYVVVSGHGCRYSAPHLHRTMTSLLCLYSTAAICKQRI